MKTSGAIESFTDYADAFMFFEHHVIDHLNDGYEIQTAEIVYLKEFNKFRVGLVFQKDI